MPRIHALVLPLIAVLVGAVVPHLLVALPAGAADATVVVTTTVTPRELTVASGTTLHWRNDDGARHRMRTVDAPTEFDTGNLESGQRAALTLTEPGTYRYVDERDRHDVSYHGVVTVTAGDPAAGSGDGTAGGGTGGTAGAGGGAPPAGSTSPPAQSSVSVLDRSFSPSAVTIATGGTVVWTNDSGRQHTVTGPGFDSGILAGGGRFSSAFPTAGTFNYVCELHEEMRGTVTVGAGGAAAPSPATNGGTGAPATSATPAAGAAASSGGDSTRAAPRAGGASVTHVVEAVDFAFRPLSVDARAGDRLRVVNRGRAPHTATASVFDTGTLRAGQEATVDLSVPGTHRFTCSFHPEMAGTVTVGAAPGAGPPSPDLGNGPAVTARAAPPPGASPPAGPEPGGPAVTPSSVEVEVQDFRFDPERVEVAQGGVVAWRFVGEAPHTVTSDDGGFGSTILRKGDRFEHRFDAPGTFSYRCDLHPAMEGTVVVLAEIAGSSPAPPGAASSPVAPIGDRRGPKPSSGGSGAGGLLAGLIGGAAILSGTGALLFGSSRMLRAGGPFGAA